MVEELHAPPKALPTHVVRVNVQLLHAMLHVVFSIHRGCFVDVNIVPDDIALLIP